MKRTEDISQCHRSPSRKKRDKQAVCIIRSKLLATLRETAVWRLRMPSLGGKRAGETSQVFANVARSSRSERGELEEGGGERATARDTQNGGGGGGSRKSMRDRAWAASSSPPPPSRSHFRASLENCISGTRPGKRRAFSSSLTPRSSPSLAYLPSRASLSFLPCGAAGSQNCHYCHCPMQDRGGPIICVNEPSCRFSLLPVISKKFESWRFVRFLADDGDLIPCASIVEYSSLIPLERDNEMGTYTGHGM